MTESVLHTSGGAQPQKKPGIQSIDVASQHVQGSVEWLLELLAKWDELPPEMRKILSEQAQQLYGVLSGNKGDSYLTKLELSELKKSLDDVRNIWASRDRTLKNANGEPENHLDFFNRVYKDYIGRLKLSQLSSLDNNLYNYFNRNKNTISLGEYFLPEN